MTEGSRILLRRLFDPATGPTATKPTKVEVIRMLAAIERETGVRERMDLGQTYDMMEHHEHPTGPQSGQWIRLGEVKRILSERDEIAAALAMDVAP